MSKCWGSPWAGMKYFDRFVESYQFWRLIKNTVYLHVYELVATDSAREIPGTSS